MRVPCCGLTDVVEVLLHAIIQVMNFKVNEIKFEQTYTNWIKFVTTTALIYVTRSAAWLGSHKVAGKGYIFTKTSQVASIGVIFTTYHTKQLYPWPNSSASRVVNYSQLSACQGDMQPFEGDLYTRGRLTSHSKSSPDNFQHQYLAELLVNVYSYCLMVKSMSCCCVHGSRLFSNLVTYVCGLADVIQVLLHAIV